MRILHVTAVYPSAADPKPGIFIQSQVASLQALGVEIDVCVLPGKSPLKYLTGVAEVRRRLRAQKYDLVHAHYMYAGWTARLAGPGTLVVSFMGNDVYGNCDAEGRYRWGSSQIHGLFSKILAQLSTHVVVKSPALGQRLGVKNQSLVPNGVDLTIFRPLPPQREKWGYRPEEFIVLFAGHPHDAVKRWPLAQRALAGLQAYVPQARMVYAENKSPAEVAQLMAAVDCLLLTSAHEGSPNVVKEALACGLPVVSVPVGDVPARLQGQEGCYVVPPEPALLAQALRQVAQRGQRLEGAVGRVDSLEATAEKLVQIYQTLISPEATP